MTQAYNTFPDGLPGNDDYGCGQDLSEDIHWRNMHTGR